MTNTRPALLAACMIFFAGTLAWGQSNPGHVNFFKIADSGFDSVTYSPAWSTIQWIQQNFAGMQVFPPYFDTRTSWYPNAYVYQNLYAIAPGSWVQYAHPEWILHDQYGRWLYVPFNCGGGTCPMFAGDIANPAFRAWWIANTQSVLAGGNYTHMFIDDVNMEFRVSDGWGNGVAPIDSNTGWTMSYDAWRSYVATFTEQIRAALPYTTIMENCIWFADGSGNMDADPYIQRQIATANYINLERGIASDPGLGGGTGFWSVYNFFSYVDRLHAAGKGVNLQAYYLTNTQQQYNLASYFLISTGNDFVADGNETPSSWWGGYNVDLGYALGPRTYSNGVYQRLFSGGMVLLGEPGLSPQTVWLPGWFQTLDGNWVNSVTVSGWQGIVLTGANSAPAPATPAAAPTSVTRYLSDMTPYYSVNGYGDVQINKSISGNPLTINGVQYQHGLGAHAFSEQRYNLNGNCSRLTATVGVDSEVPWGFANVDFQVWGDGRLLYESGYVQSGSPSGNVNLDVTGIQKIGLAVTNGIWMAPPWTTYLDHSDWAEPVITCAN